MVERPHSIRGGPGSIPGWCSSIFGIWREVLGRNVYITSQYFFPAIVYRDIISHITSTYRYIMYFFRTFKKSTAPYKVHNMGFRYIKIFLPFSPLTQILVFELCIVQYGLYNCHWPRTNLQCSLRMVLLERPWFSYVLCRQLLYVFKIVNFGFEFLLSILERQLLQKTLEN